MDVLLSYLRDIFDWLLAALIIPLFSATSSFLQAIIIHPLDLVGAPLWFEVCVVAILTGCLSIFIRRLLRVDEKEAAFQQAFMARKQAQELIKEIDDWKKQAVLYDASDKELDEKYNDYLAQRFARYGLTYLMPIFMALFWLDHLPAVEELKATTGAVFVILFPKAVMGVPGISLPLLFLSVYIITVLLYFKLRSRPPVPEEQV